MRVKRRERTIQELVPGSHPQTGKSPTKNNRSSLRHLIQARLNGPPIVDPVVYHNQRIKPQFKNLADQIAAALLDDARRGKPEALRVLIEYSEGTVMRLSALHHVIDKVFQAVESAPHITEETLYHVGKALYKLKSGRLTFSSYGRNSKEPKGYPGPHTLQFGYSEDFSEEDVLAPKVQYHRKNPTPIRTYNK